MAKKMLIQIQIVEPLDDESVEKMTQEQLDTFRDQVYAYSKDMAHEDSVVNVEITVFEEKEVDKPFEQDIIIEEEETNEV